MNKEIYFDTFRGPGWPEPNQLAPYFLAPRGKEWCYRGGNDGWSISLEGVDGTAPLHRLKGRKDIELTMWGNPDLGVLLQYSRVGGGVPRQDWFSKGNLTKLKRWVRTMHADRMPVGLYIPFPNAWLAVKEFMETEGNLPTSIEWVKSSDLPDGTFPSP